jgi:glycosyltransferase involved in cell wall biosynthesis
VTGPPKILVVAPQPFFEERGTPIALRHVVESLSDLGFAVDILTFPLGQSPEIRNVRYVRVPNYLRFRSIPIGLSFRKVWLDIFMWRALNRLLQTGEYACVHAVEEAAFLAVWPTRRLGIPLVYDMQSSMAEQLAQHRLLGRGPARLFVDRCEDWLLRNVQRVACSAGLEARAKRLVPDAHVLRWMFPGTYQNGAAGLRSELRAELGIGGDQPVVVYTGNFAEYQGVPDLAVAVGLVRDHHPHAVFVFVGATMEQAGEAGRLLRDTAPADAYRLVPRQPASKMARYLAAADVAVSPRKYGSNLPLKVIEYLAAGLPIVATGIPAHTSMLDAELAVLVEPTPASLASGISRLLDDAALRERYAEAAKGYATEHLGTAAFLLSVAKLYENLEGVGLPF